MESKIKLINQVLRLYFDKNNRKVLIPSKDFMPLFIKCGIFKKDHRDGLPIRNVLRNLDKLGQLNRIPYVHAERKGINTYWYFTNTTTTNVHSVKKVKDKEQLPSRGMALKKDKAFVKTQKLEYVQFKLNSSWFQTAYYFYLLTLYKFNKPVLYYAGQTGDRNHVTARSPFYRLTSHLKPYNGTDSQLANAIYKAGFLNQFGYENNGYGLERAFFNKELEVKAAYFKLFDFNGLEHEANRKFSEDVEQLVIRQIPKDKLINKITKRKIDNFEAEAIATRILKKLKMK